MSFRESATKKYWCFDAALAEDLALSFGVKLEYVHVRFFHRLQQDSR